MTARPLLTAATHAVIAAMRRRGGGVVECSLDLGRSVVPVHVEPDGWTAGGERYPFPERCKERTVYYWNGRSFEPAAVYSTALTKLVPTEWGAPTFEIDGIKMLPTARISPYEDARRKVELVAPQGKRVLDTCGGLGYFAAWCVALGARQVQSYERSADVRWLRGLNPWSPADGGPLTLVAGDVTAQIGGLPAASFDAVLHDPPRFGIAGELYSGHFYAELARVLRPGGLLYHYTGVPNRLTSGRDVPREVAERLRRAGFRTHGAIDGVAAVRTGR